MSKIRGKKNIVAWLLIVTMFITSCQWPTVAQAAEVPGTESEISGSEVSGGEKEELAQVVGELEELRGESSKQFLLDDGTVSLVQYDTDVHYQDEEGAWQEIDNSLNEEDAADSTDVSGYSSKEGKVKFKFAKNANANFLVRVMQGKYHIFFSAKDTQKTAEGARVLESTQAVDSDDTTLAKLVEAENVHSGIVYENLFAGADVEYVTSGSSLKENIIVKEKQDSYQYTFEIKTNHIDIRQEEDGSISFLKEDTGELLYFMPAMYMWDAEGVQSEAVTVSVSTKNKKSTLTIQADAEWINAEERVFPVTIDPTLESTSTSTGDETRIVKNQYVASGNPTVSSAGFGRGFLGYDGSGDETYRLFVQFKTLPVLPKTSVIASAKFYYAHGAYDQVGMSELTVAAKEVTESWTWGTKLNWNTQPSFSSTILDYQTLSGSTVGKYIGWDITKLIKNHYENKDNTTNTTSSFVLVGTEEGSYAYNHAAKASVIQENSAGYFSNAQPVLLIVYRDTQGLEGYYTYQTQGLGKAGTGYVGDYTKELTIVHSDFVADSQALPFELYHVYNSSFGDKYFGSSMGLNTKNYSNMKIGYGWKLNIQETIIEKTISGKQHLIYNDSDGTDHYFPLESGSTYKDEDGLKLTVTKSTSPLKYTMTDEQGNQKIFHNGFLSTILDANGNGIYLLYNGAEYSASGAWYANTGNSNRVTKIVRINKGQSTPTVLATFDYDGTTFLHAVTDHVGRTYQFKYTAATDVYENDVEYNLTKIVKPDGTLARYDYYLLGTHNVNKLARTYDSETKLGVRYTYNVTKHACHINSFGEIYWTSESAYTQGRTVDVTNTDPLQVYYRDRGLDCVSANADDIWTYCTFDNAGRTISQASLDRNADYYYGASATAYSGTGSSKTANRIQSTAVVGIDGVNLLKNGGAETVSSSVATGWSASKYASSATSSLVTTTYDSSSVRSGSRSFHVNMGSGVAANANGEAGAAFATSVSLTAGSTYTFSGYFKNTTSSNFNEKSQTYLKATSSSGAHVERSSIVDEYTHSQIENGWTRMSLTFTAKETGTYKLSACTNWIYGNSYFDDFQLEESSCASSYNYLTNGDVEWADGWSFTTGASRAAYTTMYGAYAVKITGSPKEKRTASITVPLNISSDNTLVISGWGKGTSVADINKENSSARAFGLEVVLTYSDNTTETHYASFDGSTSHLQFASKNIVPKKTGTTIKNAVVRCVYSKNANTAYFDNICLKKEPVTCYKYDSDGNVVAVAGTDTEQVDFSYSAGNLIQAKSEGEGVYKYTYDGKHNLTKVSNDGVDMVLTYDAMGHVKNTKVQNTASSGNKSISTSAAYSGNGDYLASQTDELGATTKYAVNSIGLTSTVTDALNQKTSYTYNTNNNRLTSVALDDGTNVAYNYADGVLISIVRSCLLPDGVTVSGQAYHFAYDVYDNVTEVRVGARTLASYTYMANNGPMTKITYGNSDSIEYGYDVLGRVVSEKRNGVLKYRYIYSREGALARQEELNASGTVIAAVGYEYDSLGRLIRSWEEELKGGILVRSLTTQHLYDASNRLKQQNWKTENGDARSEVYTYDSDNGTLTSLKTASGKTLSYTYDYLHRLQSRTDGNRSVSYTYKDIGSSGTSTQVSKMAWTGLEKNVSYEYTYDALGNITKIIENGTVVAEYTYDRQSQLINEKLPQSGLECTYVYDTAGNIHSITKMKNGMPMTRKFGYTDGVFKDLLMTVDNQKLTYDEIGNPLTYYSGGLWTFTWKNGRELATAKRGTTSVSYTYDKDGVRTSKTVNGVVHNYVYLGGLLVEETWGDNILQFAYDDQNRPYSVKYNDNFYYYVLNQQGDVVQVVNSSGVVRGEYVYNAWGELLKTTTTGEIGTVNPLRYRGYYYDAETGFYYLNSRYYDPGACRFISADTTDVLDVQSDLYDKNLYAYCDNNPVIRRDANGQVWITVGIMAVGGVIGGVIGAVSSAITQNMLTGTINWKSVAVAGGAGFISGAVAASPLGIGWQIGFGAGIGAASYAIDCKVNNNKSAAVDELVVATLGGGLSGAIGGPGANQNLVLTKAIQTSIKTTTRMSARACTTYAAKQIASTKAWRNNVLSVNAMGSSARFAAGTGVSSAFASAWASAWTTVKSWFSKWF